MAYKLLLCLVVSLTLLLAVEAKVYFKETFNDKDWKSRWVVPTQWKSKADMGEWGWTAGEYFADASDKAIQTSEDARFYGLSAKLDESFTNTGKQLVIQYTVKHEQDLDCGGAYIKLFHGDVDQDSLSGDTPYSVMFGPDICGSSNRKTHVIFNYPPKKDNLLIKNEVRVEGDKLSHLYTLVVSPDGTYEVLIDDVSASSGKLEENWDFLLPKEINDPDVSKPADWVDTKKIADPEDVKPDGYDDIPESTPDPDAEKPDDWDDEEDGEWEAPMIDNPDYKGPWKPKMIDNPEYKGEWKHPQIPNPEYTEDPDLYVRCKDCTHVGFELWQVKSGTMIDDIMVTDSLDEAKAFAKETFFKKQAGEKEAYDAAEEEKKAKAKEEADDEEEEDEEAEDHDEL